MFYKNVIPGQSVVRTRKTLLFALALSTTALIPLSAHAGPEGGNVTAGAGTITQNGANTTINQQSQNMAINWQSFNIGANESVNFNQPNSSSIALNRVLGQDPSQILGSLTANGQVFIMNPNGVLFGQGAQVNVGGLVASTLDVSDEDFKAGKYNLKNNGATGAVVNKGTIKAANGGYVALVGPETSNEGTIIAHMGKVVMAAGDEVSLNVDQGSLVSFSVDKGTVKALAENKQLIQADGGAVYMTAKAADAIGTAAVNNTGIIEARTVQNKNGVIILGGEGPDSQVTIAGKLDVSAASGTAGKVIATAKHVLVDEGAKIDASGAQGGGDVYIGGGWQGKDPAIKNAKAVVMARTAEIDVSAKEQGDGGTAVLWSDDYTAFHGQINAKAGQAGGKGGQVETSGKAILQATGLANTTSANGEAGEWLLDPWNVTISDSGETGTPYDNSFTPTATSTILASSIVTALDNGSNVTITTGSTGGQAGDITVNADIAKTGYSESTLTLEAANDININAAISSTPTYDYANIYGRLNVVLTANADSSGGGNINFGSGGSVTTHHGNFIAGAGDLGSVTSGGQNLTMADGSFIDVGNGVLEINMANNVELAENSLRAANSLQYPQYYMNDGSPMYSLSNYISVTAGNALTSSNTDLTKADIVTTADTRLSAANIGTNVNPIKVSGPDDVYGLIAEPVYNSNTFANMGRTLYITNTAGNSYVNEMGVQIFKTVDLTVGSQANAFQNIQIMDDPGGNGTDGTGHILVNSNGSGVWTLLEGNINTSGVAGTNTGDWTTSTDPSVFPTSVVLTAPAITFASGSVDTGGYVSYFYQGVGSYYSENWGMSSYSSSFTVNSDNATSAEVDDVADIDAVTVNLNGVTLGTLSNPLEVGSGSELNINNTGGSTFVKSTDNSFSTINLTNVKATGTHMVHFSGGDHIDYLTDGDWVYVPTISLTGCAQTTSCGMNVTDRNITLSANNGSIVFADNAVNTGRAYFTATLTGINTEGDILAENDYNAGSPVAQITADDVTFNVLNTNAPGTIGGGNKHIQLAQASGASDSELTVNTMQGNVNIHELTTNHFKTLNVTLNDVSATQNISIDLAGADDVNFSDDGTNVLIDATKVNLSANNRHWYLSTPSRSTQIDGTSLSSGDYHVSAGYDLYLNADVVTRDGSIYLIGNNGIVLMRNVTVDSNNDDTGNSGSIQMNGTISGASPGYTFTADTSSDTAAGGTINMYSGTGNGGGAYLSDVTFTSAGAASNGSQDGGIYLRNSFLLNGNFLSNGNTYIQGSLTFDTEQGNLASAGNVTFTGRNLSFYPYGGPVFNTATTASGMNGGHVNLYSTYVHGTLDTTSLSVTTTGGAGGTAGAITLPAVTTARNGYANTQSYTGGIITLNGDLLTDRGAVTLNGDVRLAANVLIDTWSAPSSVQNATAGSVTISGIGVSANQSSYGLTINTSTDTNTGFYSGSLDFDQDAGAVSIVAGNAGGHYLNTLLVNATANGTHNNGSAGAITLNNVATEGSQTYQGGALSLQGDVTTNGGALDFSDVASVNLTGHSSLKTDRAGGNGNAGLLDLASHIINGAYNLLIDVTADGTGTSRDFTLNRMGNVTPLASLDVKAKNLTVSDTLQTTGAMTLEASGATSDLTLDSTVTTSNGLITLVAGRNFINNNTMGTGIVKGTGRYLVYSTNPTDTLEGMTGYSKHYNQTYTRGQVPTYAAADSWFLYSYAPTLLVQPGTETIAFGDALPNISATFSGLIDGDTDALVTGTPVFNIDGTEPGVRDISYASGLSSGLGYIFADDTSSVGELTIKQRPNSTPGANVVSGQPNGENMVPVYVAAVQTIARPESTNRNEDFPQKETVSPLSVAVRIDNGIGLYSGTVRVANGGMRLPGDMTNTTGGDDQTQTDEQD